MKVKYKIIEVYPDEHQIVVRYYTDLLTPEKLALECDENGQPLRCRTDFALTLPYPAPEGEALHKFIMSAAPVAWLAARQMVEDPSVDTSLAHITPLLGQEFEASVNEPPASVAPDTPASATARETESEPVDTEVF